MIDIKKLYNSIDARCKTCKEYCKDKTCYTLKRYYMELLKVVLIFMVLLMVGKAEAQLVASTPVRITHPAHHYSQHWATERDPWNANYTKIMLYESSTIHPDYTGTARAGKGLVFGVLADIPALAAGDLASYEAAVKPIGGATQSISTYSQYAVWSQITGEEDIIYAIRNSDKKLFKIDTSTNPVTVTDWMNLTVTGTAPNLMGWTTDNKLIMYDSGQNSTPNQRTEINVVSKVADAPQGWYPEQCGGSSEINTYPSRIQNEIHGTWSADKSLYFRYSASSGGSDGVCDAVYSSPTCKTTEQCYNSGSSGTKLYYDSNPTMVTHISTWNDDWFIGANIGDRWIDGHNNIDAVPYLSGFDIVQVIYDRTLNTFTHNTLIENFMGAGFRRTSTTGGWSDGDHNYYGGIPSPALRKDNKQVYFPSTGGKYSYEDREYCSHFSNVPAICATVNNDANYGMIGIYITDLAPPCTSWTYTAWGACQENNTQSRTVASSLPSGCTGGSPILTQECVYATPSVNSPLQGTTLTGASQAFTWIANGATVTNWGLYVGSSQGSYDILSFGGTYEGSPNDQATGTTVTGLPTDGSTVHVRLYYKISGSWYFVDTTYTAYTASGDPDTVMAISLDTPHAIYPKGMPIKIKYTLENINEAVTVDIKYDTTNTGCNGTAFTECQNMAEAAAYERCSVATGSLAPGTYYICGTSTSEVGTNKVYIPEKIIISPCTAGSNHACAGTVKVGN